MGPVACRLDSLGCLTVPAARCPDVAGASAGSLSGDRARTSQAAGGARPGKGLSPDRTRASQERPTEEGVLKLRRWAAKGRWGGSPSNPRTKLLETWGSSLPQRRLASELGPGLESIWGRTEGLTPTHRRFMPSESRGQSVSAREGEQGRGAGCGRLTGH